MTSFDHAAGSGSSAHRYRPDGGRVGTGAGRAFPSTESWLPDARGSLPIGVVDTGLWIGASGPHPFLDGRVDHRPDDREPDPDTPEVPPEFGHGTFVAGLILREAPDSYVLMRRGLLGPDDDPADEDRRVVEGIGDLLSAGVRIINLSFEGPGAEGCAPPDLVAVLRAAATANVLVVVSVTNDPTAGSSFPAQLARPDGEHADIAAVLLPVVAGDETMRLPLLPADEPVRAPGPTAEPPLANFAWQPPDAMRWLRTRAGGVNVLGPTARHDHDFAGWARWSGSSFAAAVVTGRIAAQTAARSAAEPGVTPLEVAKSFELSPGSTPVDLLAEGAYLYGRDSGWATKNEPA